MGTLTLTNKLFFGTVHAPYHVIYK